MEFSRKVRQNENETMKTGYLKTENDDYDQFEIEVLPEVFGINGTQVLIGRLGEKRVGFFRESGKEDWVAFDAILTTPEKGIYFHQITAFPIIQRIVRSLKGARIPEDFHSPTDAETLKEKLLQFEFPKNEDRDWKPDPCQNSIIQLRKDEKEKQLQRSMTVLVEGIPTHLHYQPGKSLRAFCQDQITQGWYPIKGFKLGPSLEAVPVTQPFYDDRIPEGLLGYGSEENKTICQTLNRTQPKPQKEETPHTINILLGKEGREIEMENQRFLRQDNPKIENNPQEPPPMTWVKTLPENTKGKDIIIGDLRGQKEMLIATLAQWQFNPNTDRVICTGDLWNQDSECIHLLDYPWFHSARGDQDHLLLQYLKSPDSPPLQHNFTPPKWAQYLTNPLANKSTQAKRQHLINLLESTPLLLKVGETQNRYHVTHSCPNIGTTNSPKSLSNQQIDKLERGEIGIKNPLAFMQDTTILEKTSQNHLKAPSNNRTVAPVFSGHSPEYRNSRNNNNHYFYLDTGAGTNTHNPTLSSINPKTKKGLQISYTTPTLLETETFLTKKPKKEPPQPTKKQPQPQKTTPDFMNPLPVISRPTKKQKNKIIDNPLLFFLPI